MAVGIRQVCGRLSAAKPFVCIAAKCVWLRRRGCDAFGRFAHSAWASRVWPVAIRWLGSDLRSGQRREYRPNVLALALRRVVASGRLVRPRTHRVHYITYKRWYEGYTTGSLIRLYKRLYKRLLCTYKRWYRDRFQLPRRMVPALTNARDRTAPVVGKGRASNRAGAALPAPTSRVATGTGMVLHMDALGGVPKGVTTKTVIERADRLYVYVPCVTDSTCKSCTPTYRTTGSSW